jgi:hypothetical protein
MNKLDQCYLEALSEALKGNLGEALELRNEADALASEGFSFSEDYGSKYPFIEEAVNTLINSYEFTRCVRANGTAYGTKGSCKKGKEEAKEASLLLKGKRYSALVVTRGATGSGQEDRNGVSKPSRTPHQKLPKVTNEERNIRRAMDRRSLALMKQISKELNKDEGSLEVLKELSKRQKTDEKFTALRSRAVEIVKELRAQQKKKTDL